MLDEKDFDLHEEECPYLRLSSQVMGKEISEEDADLVRKLVLSLEDHERSIRRQRQGLSNKLRTLLYRNLEP
ncbi:hypothetical protein JXL21_02515 [Candidatus Bathyarchaeota archaeon]|nr:hypothetical protein [Candidatus Bathyarchaeota archaeon]